jgi:hypothetical protein
MAADDDDDGPALAAIAAADADASVLYVCPTCGAVVEAVPLSASGEGRWFELRAHARAGVAGAPRDPCPATGDIVWVRHRFFALDQLTRLHEDLGGYDDE